MAYLEKQLLEKLSKLTIFSLLLISTLNYWWLESLHLIFSTEFKAFVIFILRYCSFIYTYFVTDCGGRISGQKNQTYTNRTILKWLGGEGF